MCVGGGVHSANVEYRLTPRCAVATTDLKPGPVLDSNSSYPCAQSHRKLVEGVVGLARRVQADPELSSLIRRKFAIKCTTGT